MIRRRGRSVGIAGIMGGDATGVSADTRNILFESAFFEPAVIAGRARRFGLQTDASMRFERGVDPAGQAMAIERATALLLEIAGGRPGPTVVSGTEASSRPAVRVRRRRIADLLGLDLDDGTVETIFTRLGIRVERVSDGWQLAPPSFRFDLAIEVDFIEEVARIHGYAHVPVQAGQQATRLGTVPEDRVPVERAALTLVERGYQEAVTYSFTDPALDRSLAGGRDGAHLKPISTDSAYFFAKSAVAALRHNLARQQRRSACLSVKFIPKMLMVKNKIFSAGVGCCGWIRSIGAPEVPPDLDIRRISAVLASPVRSAFDFSADVIPLAGPHRRSGG